MTFEFIKSLNDVKSGVYYYQDNTGKIEICCYVYDLRITDLENLVVYTKTNILNPVELLKTYIDGLKVKDVKSLIKVLSSDDSFKSYTIEKKYTFNPFIKELDGKLEIKVKSNKLTKTQIKKILSHKDTEVVISSKYSDDYAYDNEMNFFKGVKVSRLSALYDVFSYFDYAYREKDNSISLCVAGYSKIFDVKNKNLVFIES